MLSLKASLLLLLSVIIVFLPKTYGQLNNSIYTDPELSFPKLLQAVFQAGFMNEKNFTKSSKSYLENINTNDRNTSEVTIFLPSVNGISYYFTISEQLYQEAFSREYTIKNFMEWTEHYLKYKNNNHNHNNNNNNNNNNENNKNNKNYNNKEIDDAMEIFKAIQKAKRAQASEQTKWFLRICGVLAFYFLIQHVKKFPPNPRCVRPREAPAPAPTLTPSPSYSEFAPPSYDSAMEMQCVVIEIPEEQSSPKDDNTNQEDDKSTKNVIQNL